MAVFVFIVVGVIISQTYPLDKRLSTKNMTGRNIKHPRPVHLSTLFQQRFPRFRPYRAVYYKLILLLELSHSSIDLRPETTIYCSTRKPVPV
jgi:hypothetical protein